MFPVDAEIELDGVRSSSGFLLYADVVLSGSELTMTAPATVTYCEDSVLRFENDVAAATGIQFSIREQKDEIHPYEIEGNITAEDKLLFSNVNLNDMDAIVATLHCQFGGASGEGKFGKDYSVYFSILSAVARGVTTRNGIEQTVGRQVGGHLTRLEEDYHLLSKRVPFGAKTTRQIRYQIDDPFYRFWFRFIFRYDQMVQMKSFDLLRKLVKRDYPAFSGLALESYFRTRFAESGNWTNLGSWWDRKGENEIDLIAENELNGTLAVAEIKREGRRIDLDLLRRKFASCETTLSGRQHKEPTFLALSMEDM